MIKGRYVRMNAEGWKAAKVHLAYLERDGVERDGAPGRLYGPEDGFDWEAFGRPIEEEQRQFRFIVSPEDGHRLDLTAFARRFMGQVAKDLGRRLTWAAVNHHNTDNAHVHIVIRGVDADGDDLRIDGRYIGQGMRWRAQEILTRELGMRSELEIAQEQSREVTRDGFTLIDWMLVGHVAEDGRVMPERLAAAPHEERAACLARLQTLEQMGLARGEPAGVWRLESGWEARLKKLEAFVEVRERLYRHIPASLGRGQSLEVGTAFETVEGVVRGVGLHDELGGEMYLVVERNGGGGCHVAVRPEVAAGLAVGDAVKVSSPTESWVKPTDCVVARVALEHGGVYDPVEHQNTLQLRAGSVPGDGRPSPAELVAANVRRLERLERYGLVERRPGGRWRVPSDLVATLEARERTHPRHRLQINRVGPERKVDRDGSDRPGGRGRGPGVSR